MKRWALSNLTLSRIATVIGDAAFLGEGGFLGDGPALEEDGVFTMMSLVGVVTRGPHGETWS